MRTVTELQTPRRLPRWWPVLLLALLPAIPLWRCIFLSEAIGPFDQIRQMAPWNGPKPTQPWDVLQADGVLQFYPWRDMVFKAWGHGQLPLWNPYELAGTPLLANSQSAGFYPPHVLLGLLHVPTAVSMTVLAWLHLFWAGLGVYLLARRFGASELGAVVAGASFELSAFLLAWTALPSVIETVAWIPWMLVATHSLLFGNKGFPLLALSAGMMLLAGHLQFAAYGFMAAVLVACVMAWTLRPRWDRIALFVGALALGGALSAPQLLPVLNYSQSSHRRNSPTQDGYVAYTAGGIKPFELANLAQPYALGSPRDAVDIGQGRTVGAYWPALAKQGANLAESAVTIGPFVFALLILVPWKERRVWPFASLAIIALLLALGTALNWPLYFLIPGWSSTGSPGRIIVLFVMCAAVLAGLSVDAGASRLRHKWAAVAALLLPIGLLAISLTAAPNEPGLAEIAREALVSSIPMACAFGALAALGVLVLVQGSLERFRPALVLVPILLALGYAGNLVTTGTPIPVEPVQSFDRVAILNGSWSLHFAAPAYAPPNTAYLLGLHELGGYDSLLHRDTKAMLDAINAEDSAPPANGNMMFIKPHDSLDFFSRLAGAGVSEVLSRDPAASQTFRDLAPVGRVEVQGANGPKPVISDESFSSITVQATGPGRLILRDRKMPGWLAKIDGKHVPIGGSLWREVDLPPGPHAVRFDYVPPGLMAGIFLAVPAWLATLALALFRMRSARSSREAFTPAQGA